MQSMSSAAATELTAFDLAALEAEITARYTAGDTEPPVLWAMRDRATAMRAQMARQAVAS